MYVLRRYVLRLCILRLNELWLCVLRLNELWLCVLGLRVLRLLVRLRILGLDELWLGVLRLGVLRLSVLRLDSRVLNRHGHWDRIGVSSRQSDPIIGHCNVGTLGRGGGVRICGVGTCVIGKRTINRIANRLRVEG